MRRPRNQCFVSTTGAISFRARLTKFPMQAEALAPWGYLRPGHDYLRVRRRRWHRPGQLAARQHRPQHDLSAWPLPHCRRHGDGDDFHGHRLVDVAPSDRPRLDQYASRSDIGALWFIGMFVFSLGCIGPDFTACRGGLGFHPCRKAHLSAFMGLLTCL
jgi:hypothetical protein